jgi:rubrerythrin
MESQWRRVAGQFDATRRLVDEAGEADLRRRLEEVERRFALACAPLQARAAGGESRRQGLAGDFQRAVAREGVSGELDAIARRAGRRVRRERNLARQLREARQAELGQGAPVRRIDYRRCGECEVDMEVDSDTAELRCPSCRATRELAGTVFDDAQFYNQEGQKAKSGSFKPNRHLRFWITHILAQESEEELSDPQDPEDRCGAKLLSRLREIVRRDHKVLRLLSVEDVRGMLQEVGRTNLYYNTSLILKKLTGRGPPSLPERYLLRTEKIFADANRVREQVANGERVHRNYYPFYIHRIWDAILPADDEEGRRALDYIHMQGEDTVANNDAEWKRVCEGLGSVHGIRWRAARGADRGRNRAR